MVWKLTDAKNKFSEVVEKVFRMIRRRFGPKISFIDFLFKGPGLEDIDLKRDKSSLRNDFL
jgi:hypothetical protein